MKDSGSKHIIKAERHCDIILCQTVRTVMRHVSRIDAGSLTIVDQITNACNRFLNGYSLGAHISSLPYQKAPRINIDAVF